MSQDGLVPQLNLMMRALWVSPVRLSELSSDLGIGLLQAMILLAMFIDVLWNISQAFGFQVGHRMITHDMHDTAGQIQIEQGFAGKFVIDRLEIASPGGATMLKEAHAEIKIVERGLIVGETGTLRELLAYPDTVENYRDEQYTRALERIDPQQRRLNRGTPRHRQAKQELARAPG